MINNVKLTNFRSHQSLGISIDPRTTAIIGRNASGKTNILESIYYGFITKSFKATQASLIKRDSDFSKINISYHIDKDYDIEYRIKKTLNSASRTITINKINKKPSEVLGIQPVVIFVPDDVRIITDGPQLRRNLLNSIIIQVSKPYLVALNKFQKVLNQRNKLLNGLKHGLSGNKDQLFIYNLQLAEPIEIIYQHRDMLIKFINSVIGQHYSAISGNKDNVRLEYLSTLPKNKEDILKSLEDSTNEDIRIGFSSRGPHKDEVSISLNGYKVRDSLSRGENRSLALSIKLSEIDYIKINNSNPPLLLLDDVLSELDHERQQHLLEHTKGQQTILTATDMADNISGYKIVNI